MVTRIFTFCVVLAVCSGSTRVTYGENGPLNAANRFPLHLLFLTPKPISPDLPSQGDLDATLSIDYSNTFFEHSSNRWDVLIDMELLVLNLDLVYGLASRWGLRMDLPVVSMNDGFLDGFLGNFHDALGVGDYDRHTRPQDQFAYTATKSDEVWFKGRPHRLELADTTVAAHYALLKPSARCSLASSLLISLKLPTGDKSAGLGSGNFDLGLFLPSKWGAGPLYLYCMPGYSFIGSPKIGRLNVKARDVCSLFAGAAYDTNANWTWLLQVNAYSTPLEFTGIGELDDGAVDLAIGCQFRATRNWLIELAFSEDLTRTAPDFNVRLALRWMADPLRARPR